MCHTVSPSSDNVTSQSHCLPRRFRVTISSGRHFSISFPSASMRHHSLILVVTALLASAHEALKPAESQINTRDTVIFTTPHTLSQAFKSPRINHKDDDEERGVNIPAVEKLTNSLKSADDLDDLVNKGASVDDVFKLPTLDNVADNVLANPNLKDWMNYIKLFNMKNPTKKTSVIATLTAYYGDEGLAKIIEAAKHVSSSAAIAKRLQSEQLRYWISQKYTPDDVLVILKLDDGGDQLFTKPQVLTWVQYVDDFNQANLDKQTTLFSALKTHYDEPTLVSMLIAAKKVPSTESIAIRVQSEQTKLWMHDKRSPSEIFTLLKLDEGQPFTNPVFNAWMKYSDEFNMIMIDPENKVSLMSTLRKHYEDLDLAKMILAASKSPDMANLSKRLYPELLREWKNNVKPPEFYFKALKLDKTGLKLFERSMYPVWSDYMNFVSMMDPTIKLNLLAPLTRVYGEKKLAKILITAVNVPSTKKIASELLDVQINRWLSEKKDTKKVSSLLRVGETATDDASKLFYDKYLEAFKNLP